MRVLSSVSVSVLQDVFWDLDASSTWALTHLCEIGRRRHMGTHPFVRRYIWLGEKSALASPICVIIRDRL